MPEIGSEDHIVRCCMKYQLRITGHGGLLVLFTNDVQLSCIATNSRVHSLNRKVCFVTLAVTAQDIYIT